MEYLDLDLRPMELSSRDTMQSVCNLIVNAIRQYHNQEYATKLIVDYDETTNTLKIKDHGTGINLSDFVQKPDYQNDWFAMGLRVAISNLLAWQITPIFKSNFGTFTPVIRNKEGLSESIASIFIAYQPREPRVNQWIDLKFVDEQVTDHNHGTEITISPLSANFVADLKYHFSFLLPWTETIKTEYGTVLVNNEIINNIFVDGENVTLMHNPNPDDEDQSEFMFSYDINSEAFDSNVIKDRYNNISKYAFKCIKKIYEELSDDAKEFVFGKLLNNHDSIEWNSKLIRNYIIKYFAHTNPNKYLIGIWDSENPNFVEFAKKSGKEIIWVKDSNEFDEVVDLGIENVLDFGQEYANQNCTKFVDINELTPKEKTNWDALQSFLTYFVKVNKEIQDQLAKNDLDHYEIKIAQNLPSTHGFFMFDQDFAVIDRKLLSYKFSALLAGCQNVIYIPTGDISADNFNQLWFDSIANYIIVCQQESNKQK